MKKIVLKLNLHDNKDKQKAMQKVSSMPGVESISMDMKEKKLTVIGDIDAVNIVRKLRKLCDTDVVSVGEAKEEKKEEPKKDGEAKKKDQKDEMADLIKAYNAYYYNPNNYMTPYYHATVVHQDLNPNGCVIS